MITPDDVRSLALALPEVVEGTHFGLPSFSVRGKAVVGLQKGGTHAIVQVPQAEAEELAAGAPDVYEAVSRPGGRGRIFVGVRVDLARVDRDRLRRAVASAWRHRAPRRLVAAHPGIGDELPAGLAAPAVRALAAAGYVSLGQLTGVTAAEIGALHGVGPTALRRLAAALAATDRSFADG